MGREGPRRRALSSSLSEGSLSEGALREVLSPGAPFLAEENVAAWWSAFGPALAQAPAPWDAAVLGGARADRLGFAFAAGYQAALWSLVPARDLRRTAALCATEAGGAHPRAIETRLTHGVLEGEKTFVTLGPHAQDLYVLAKTGEEAGRPALALVRLDAAAPGVTVTPLGETPFVPESRTRPSAWRACARSRRCRATAGRTTCGPFAAWRTRWCMRLRWRGWVPAGCAGDGRASRIERLAALLLGLRSLSEDDLASPLAHIALAGALESGGLAGRGDGAAVGARARGGPETLEARSAAPRRGEQSPREASRARLGAPVGAGDGSSVMQSARPSDPVP